MVDKNKTKTKAEMLLELESIKGLLHEEDDIPILQETTILREPIAAEKVSPIVKPVATQSVTSPPISKAPDLKSRADEQPDLFHKPVATDSATQLLNTLNDFAALAETVTTHKVSGQSANPGAINQRTAQQSNANHSTVNQSAASQNIANQQTATNSAVEKARAAIARAEITKFSGENPFLPQHIRTRLHGNNPPPNFEFETARKISNSSRPTTQLGNTQQNFATTKPVSHQQEMIDDIIEAMLPHITKALRDRLAGMSKEMLEILLEENDRF